MPGVAHAAGSMALPPSMTTMAPCPADDEPFVAIGHRPAAQWSAITPAYFGTLGIAIRAGRVFTTADDEAVPLVVHRQRWTCAATLAECVAYRQDAARWPLSGVRSSYRRRRRREEQRARAGTDAGNVHAVLAATVAGDASGAPCGRRRSADAGQRRPCGGPLSRSRPAITGVQSVEASLTDSVATARLPTALVAGFAAIGVLMAAAGLYGVIAHTVERRTREIGVRVALGAEPWSPLRLVAGEGLRLITVGIIVGTVAAAIVSRAMRSLLFDVSPGDPLTYAMVALAFIAVGCAASIVPARGALRVDPSVALRAEVVTAPGLELEIADCDLKFARKSLRLQIVTLKPRPDRAKLRM